MVPKRHFSDEGDGDFAVPDSKRRPIFKTVLGDLTRGITLNEAVWEPFLRRVVRDQVERTVFSVLNSRAPVPQAGSSGGRGLKLHFVNKVPSTIFTGSRIESEDSEFIQINLMDASSQTIVNSGPLSSMKIEIVALNGEFGSDDQEDWTEKEFNDSIVREREGKRPLVTGDRILSLREGVGYVGGNVIFTDNSSWIRSRRFRLGARVVQKVSGNVRIREARSEPFVVKDHRGELYRKHHPPYLHDEVWRLEKIAKDGAFHNKLSSCKIQTVKDFLQLYMRDPSSLRQILGKISNRTWNVIVGHAMNYVNDNIYAYHRIEHDVSIYFDSIYKVVGATFNGQLCSLDELNPSQKVLVENLKQQAYRNVNALVLVDDLSIAGLPRPLASLQAVPFTDQSLDLQHDFQLMPEDQPMIQLGLSQPSTQSSNPCGAESSHQLVLSAPQNNHSFQVLPQAHRDNFSMEDFLSTHFNGEPHWSPGGSQGPIIPSNHFAENLFQLPTPSFSPSNGTWEQGPSFPYNEAEHGLFPPTLGIVHISNDRKRRASWGKIRAAFKFWLSVKLAARKMGRPPLYLGY